LATGFSSLLHACWAELKEIIRNAPTFVNKFFFFASLQFLFFHDFKRIIKTREEAARLGREGESLPLSSPSRPGSFNQSKFIHLLKSEGGRDFSSINIGTMLWRTHAGGT
jgi:hypothetical protein